MLTNCPTPQKIQVVDAYQLVDTYQHPAQMCRPQPGLPSCTQTCKFSPSAASAAHLQLYACSALRSATRLCSAAFRHAQAALCVALWRCIRLCRPHGAPVDRLQPFLLLQDQQQTQ